ncbi:MAG: hypothetical protein ACP5N2_02805 [Candidatus Nanoarchaeia archaeon]
MHLRDLMGENDSVEEIERILTNSQFKIDQNDLNLFYKIDITYRKKMNPLEPDISNPNFFFAALIYTKSLIWDFKASQLPSEISNYFNSALPSYVMLFSIAKNDKQWHEKREPIELALTNNFNDMFNKFQNEALTIYRLALSKRHYFYHLSEGKSEFRGPHHSLSCGADTVVSYVSKSEKLNTIIRRNQFRTL